MTTVDSRAVLAQYRERYGASVQRTWERSPNAAGAHALKALAQARHDLETEEPRHRN